MTKLTALHVLDSFESGGAQRATFSLAEWLTAQGVDVVISGAPGPLAEQAPEGVEVVLRTAERSSMASHVRHLSDLVRRHCPDIIHAHQRREALIARIVAKRFGLPVVEHAHTQLPHSDRRRLSFRSDHIFAVSLSVARMVVEDFHRDPENVTVTGNTPAQPIPPDSSPRQRLPHEPARILAVGRVVEQKDPLRWVDTLAALQHIRPVEARWVGSGDLMDQALTHASERTAPVDFTGEFEDVSAEFAWADLLLMTSRWEGAPLVLLEAMSHHVPVAATGVGGVEELAGHGRGLVLPAEATPTEIAQEVDRLLSSPDHLATITSRAAEYVAQEATPEKVFSPVLEVYRKLCAPGRGMDGRRVHLYNVPLDLVSTAKATQRIEQKSREKAEPYLVVTPNTDHFMRTQRDASFLEVYERADLSVPDGMPLVSMLRFHGITGAHRITGADLFFEVARLLGLRGGRLAIIGGLHGTAAQAAENLKNLHPGLHVPVVEEPAPQELKSEAYLQQLASFLQEQQVDVVALCLGSPKQEQVFLALQRYGAPSVPYLCTGAAVDFAAATVARAPQQIQNAGMEWAFRLMQEPRRLWRRYLVGNPRILPYFLRSALRGRRSPL